MGASNYKFSDSFIGETTMAFVDMSNHDMYEDIDELLEMIRDLFSDHFENWGENMFDTIWEGRGVEVLLLHYDDRFAVVYGHYNYNTIERLPIAIVPWYTNDDIIDNAQDRTTELIGEDADDEEFDLVYEEMYAKELAKYKEDYKFYSEAFYNALRKSGVLARYYGGPYTSGGIIE